MHYGLVFPILGSYSDARMLVDLAHVADSRTEGKEK